MAATEAVLINSAGSESSSNPAESGEIAFEAAFLEHYGRLVGILRRLTGSHAEAEELASEVFCRLYRHRLPAGRRHNLGGWLYRTAMRLGIDALRAANRRKRYEQAAMQEAADAGPSADPLDGMLRAERCRQVKATLAKLKPAHAQLLVLRSSGLSYREVAEAVGVKPSSIGTMLARAEAEFERVYRKLSVS